MIFSWASKCTATPNMVEQGTSRKIMWWKQGYHTGFSLLQGKTVTLTGWPCFHHRISLLVPCSTLLGVAVWQVWKFGRSHSLQCFSSHENRKQPFYFKQRIRYEKTNETQCTTLCLLLYTQPSPTKQGWIQFIGFLSF